MHLLDLVIPGQCFIYEHTKIFRIILLYEYVAIYCLYFGLRDLVIWSKLHFWASLESVKADGTPLGRLQLALEKLTCTLGMREKKMRTHME